MTEHTSWWRDWRVRELAAKKGRRQPKEGLDPEKRKPSFAEMLFKPYKDTRDFYPEVVRGYLRGVATPLFGEETASWMPGTRREPPSWLTDPLKDTTPGERAAKAFTEYVPVFPFTFGRTPQEIAQLSPAEQLLPLLFPGNPFGQVQKALVKQGLLKAGASSKSVPAVIAKLTPPQVAQVTQRLHHRFTRAAHAADEADMPIKRVSAAQEAIPDENIWPQSIAKLEPEGKMKDAIVAARVVVEQHKPGLISKLVDYVPGISKLRRITRPGLDLPQELLEAYVVEGGLEAALQTTAYATRFQVLKGLSDAFGKGAIAGQKLKIKLTGLESGKTPFSRFVGHKVITKEGKEYPALHTLYDVVQRTNLYRLNPTQLAAIRAMQKRNLDDLTKLGQQYGIEVNPFTPKQGAAYLPNVNVSDDVIEAVGSRMSAAIRGREKFRSYDSGHARWLVEGNKFKPETNIELLLLGLDTNKSRAVGRKGFGIAAGGKTRPEVMSELYPDGVALMLELQTKVAGLQRSILRIGWKEDPKGIEALNKVLADFAASPLDPDDVKTLLAGLNKAQLNILKFAGEPITKLEAGRVDAINFLKSVVRSQNRPLKGYTLVPEPGSTSKGLYYPTDIAKQIQGLREISTNRYITWIDEHRGIVLNFDISPLTGIQVPYGFLQDPRGRAIQFAKGIMDPRFRKDILYGFRAEALAKDIADDPASWELFASMTGRPVARATPQEFAGNWLNKLPGYTKLNEGIFTLVTRMAKKQFDSHARTMIRQGKPDNLAFAAAGDMVNKNYPMVFPRLAGQSPARAKNLRAAFMSISYLTRPVELTLDAGRGLFKLGTRQALTPKEYLGTKVLATTIGSTTAAAVMSHAVYAQQQGLDVKKAVLQSLDPDSSYFMSLVLPNGARIPLGAPLRGFLRAILPGKETPPFAGLPRWLKGKVSPIPGTIYDLINNKDFYGNKIMTGQFPEQVLSGIEYIFERNIPLVLGTGVGARRRGLTFEEGAQDVSMQLGGTPYNALTVYQRRNEAVERWASEKGLKDVKSYYELNTEQKSEFRNAHPEEYGLIQEEIERQAKLGQPWAIKGLNKEELRDNQVIRDISLEKGRLNDRSYSPKMWIDNYHDSQARSSAATKMFEELEKPTYRTPRNDNERALHGYYEEMKQHQLQGGQFDYDSWRDASDEYLASLSFGQRKYVVERLHPNATDRVLEYLKDKKETSKYYALTDELLKQSTPPLSRTILNSYRRSDKQVKRQREYRPYGILERRLTREKLVFRSKNPKIDFLLRKWGSVTTARTIEARDLWRDFQKLNPQWGGGLSQTGVTRRPAERQPPPEIQRTLDEIRSRRRGQARPKPPPEIQRTLDEIRSRRSQYDN